MTAPRALAVLLVVCATAGTAGAGEPPGAPPRGAPIGPREAEPPIIELLTFGVGGRIFERYGHAAICLRYHDPRSQPVCFNYGVTGFDDGPILIWRFLRGEQRFWVEPAPRGEPWTPSHGRPRGMIGFYTWEDRDIWSQRLPLTGDQARAIEDRVWDSLRADRRFYTYDHFRDNCTTRLRDLLDEVTGGKLREGAGAPYPLTYRELGRRGLAELPPLLVLTDFLIGRAVDVRPTPWEAMFHPDVLRRAVRERLGAAPRPIHRRAGPPFPASGPSGRLPMAAIGLVFALPLLGSRGLARLARRTAGRLGLGGVAPPLVAGMSLAASGVLLWIGWRAGAAPLLGLGALLVLGVIAMSERAALIFAASHLALWGAVVYAAVILSPIPDVRWNEAVLVVTPLDAALPLFGERLRRGYARVRVAMLLAASLLGALGVLVQPLWVPILVAFMPLAVLAFDLPRALFGEREAATPSACRPPRATPPR